MNKPTHIQQLQNGLQALVGSSTPGSVHLTNEQIEDILLHDDLLVVPAKVPVKDTQLSEEVVPVRHQSKLP